MKRLKTLILLDFTMIIRNRILAVAAVITILYVAIIQVLPGESFTMVLTMLIFSDPVMLGFMFTGAMVLFEKNSNTLQALSVTPVRPGEYLLSKGIALTSVALAASLIMAVAGLGFSFGLLYLGLAVVFSSLLFVYIGFIGVSRVKTFNQYFIVIPLFMLPTCLPLLNYFGATDTIAWYIVPTQASLILFTAAFEGTSGISSGDMVYALLYLPAATIASYRLAVGAYYKIL
jgi:fluoroquinolone transport system permease protein